MGKAKRFHLSTTFCLDCARNIFLQSMQNNWCISGFCILLVHTMYLGFLPHFGQGNGLLTSISCFLFATFCPPVPCIFSCFTVCPLFCKPSTARGVKTLRGVIITRGNVRCNFHVCLATAIRTRFQFSHLLRPLQWRRPAAPAFP